MTTTTTGTGTFVPGDKVRILPGATRYGFGNSAARHVGQVVTVVAGPDSDGDVYVRLEDSSQHIFVLPQFLQKETPEAPAEPEKVEAFELGRKYEITQDLGGHGFPTGTVVKALKFNSSVSSSVYCTTDFDVEVGSEPTWRYGQNAWVNLTDVKPVLAEWERELLGMTPATPEDDAALTQARAEAEAAVKELEDFKARVRVDLIAESYRQGQAWIDSVDEWLDELGLPSQYGDLPVAMQSVVLLTDNRLARLADVDTRPWEVKRITESGAEYIRYYSTQEVIDAYVSTVYVGPDLDDTIIARRTSGEY